MFQDPESLPDNEEADSETLASFGIETGERIEDFRDPLARNTDSSVVHVDANARTETPAADKDAPTRLGISDRVADQIPQGRTQQQVIAHDPIVARYDSQANPLAQRRMFVLSPSLLQHLMKRDRLELQVHRVISNLYCNLDLLQLLLEPVDRPPAALQPPLLGARSDSEIEMVMGTFDCLDRPKQILAGDFEQHRLKPRVPMDTNIGSPAPVRLADDDTVCGELVAPLYRPKAASRPVHVALSQEGATGCRGKPRAIVSQWPVKRSNNLKRLEYGLPGTE
jgi:hypothetical protein